VDLPTVYDRCGEPCPIRVPDYRLHTGDTDFIPDIDGDCRVGASDLLLVLANWGPCRLECCRGDLDRDGVIGTSDLTRVIVNWTRDDPEAPERVR